MNKRLVTILALIAVVALVLGLIYYAFLMPKPIPADIKEMMDQLPRYYPDDFAKTIEAAREEGSLTLYSGLIPAALGEIVATQVEKMYGVTVNLYSAGGETVLAKLLAERETGTYACDVLTLSDPLAMDNLSKQGIMMQYEAAERASFNPDYVDSNYYYYTYTGFSAGFAYNTALVNESDLPKS